MRQRFPLVGQLVAFRPRPSAWAAAAVLIFLSAPVFVPVAAWAQPRGVAHNYRTMREAMVQEVIVGGGIKNPAVIESMRNTPRHEFMPIAQRDLAYVDMGVPIGEKQTISPPFVVASMTERLDPKKTDVVLEIGTGSGYQSAVLSPLVKEVYTIEIKEKLHRRATETLKRLAYKNVHTKLGDGYQGWPEHAPFDKIIVTCSPENVPQPLVDQLKEGGRMIIPVGERFTQVLYLLRKTDGKLEKEAIEGTFFVPMTGTAEDQRQVEYDAAHPRITNGGFETSTVIKGLPDSWYYVRLAKLKTGNAPEGRQYLEFVNTTPGRLAQALQGFGVDGRKVHRLRLRLQIKVVDVRPGLNVKQKPGLMIQFYDAERAPTGSSELGPWSGSFDWMEKATEIEVPAKARIAIVYVGMVGATGEFAVDDFTIEVVDEKKGARDE